MRRGLAKGQLHVSQWSFDLAPPVLAQQFGDIFVSNTGSSLQFVSIQTDLNYGILAFVSKDNSKMEYIREDIQFMFTLSMVSLQHFFLK